MDPKYPSFLFIPDISGFTEFVNRTEVEHSQHIISELLESIIDSNILDLEISEVEGDAVLFYKRKEVPTLPEVLEQSRTMFINFHNIVNRYEKQRICNCGACSAAVDLKLKFVAHCGEFGFITVKGNEKPHGYDVVLIHKLLKNNVDLREYLLWPDTYNCASGSKGLSEIGPWVELCDGHSEYDKLGRVDYKYIPLDPLHDQFSKAEVDTVERILNPVVHEIFIDREPHFIFQYIIRFDLRNEWNRGLKDITYEDHINRVGSKHICVLDSGTLEIETVTDGKQSESALVYGEKVLNPPFPFKSLLTFYNIRPDKGGSRVRLEIDYLVTPFLKWLRPLIAKAAEKQAQSVATWLKEGAEKYQGNFPN